MNSNELSAWLTLMDVEPDWLASALDISAEAVHQMVTDAAEPSPEVTEYVSRLRGVFCQQVLAIHNETEALLDERGSNEVTFDVPSPSKGDIIFTEGDRIKAPSSLFAAAQRAAMLTLILDEVKVNLNPAD